MHLQLRLRRAERMLASARDYIGGCASRPRPRVKLAEVPANGPVSAGVAAMKTGATPDPRAGNGTIVASVNIDD